MAKGWVFRRIGGRIVPFKVSPGFKPDATVAASSAKIRDAMKGRASGKTNLQEKRVQAIRAVRDVVSGKNRNQVGQGFFLEVYQPSNPKVVVKVPGADPKGGDGVNTKLGKVMQAQIARRAVFKSVLSKAGLAPETFLVKTTKRNYLVQAKSVPFRESKLYYTDRAVPKLESLRNRMRNRMHVGDDHPGNLAVHKGKIKSVDSGSFWVRTKISYGNYMTPLQALGKVVRERVKKFRITPRNAGKRKK